MSAVTVDQFRENFPEFSSALTYPPAELNFWFGLSDKLLSANRWGDVLDFGQQLFVAHNLSLQQAAKGGANGAAPGQIVGPVSSASVDKVSYTRDVGSVMDPANGHWNLSTYGLRYIQLVKMFGAGPVQVGVPSPSEWQPGAWPGPVFYPDY